MADVESGYGASTKTTSTSAHEEVSGKDRGTPAAAANGNGGAGATAAAGAAGGAAATALSSGLTAAGPFLLKAAMSPAVRITLRSVQVVLSLIAFSVMASATQDTEVSKGMWRTYSISFSWQDAGATAFVFSMGLIAFVYAIAFLVGEIVQLLVLKKGRWPLVMLLVQVVMDHLLSLLIFGAACAGGIYSTDYCKSSDLCDKVKASTAFIFLAAFSFITSFWLFLYLFVSNFP